MYKLYDSLDSGNGYKVRLLLTLQGHDFERIEVDIDHGGSRTPEFLKKNPNGRIPVLELDDGTCLSESNAILWYLADGTAFLPEGPLNRARVLQWMFFEQYSHEPNIAVSRHWLHKGGLTVEQRKILKTKADQGHAALAVLEGRLKEGDFLAGDAYSIADIALYAYTHVADEGGFDLEPYPAIRAWLDRAAGQPGHIPITQG